MYLYEALGAPDIDHLRRRKKREAEAPSLLEKRDLAFRDDKQRRLLKREKGTSAPLGLKSKDFVKMMMRRAMRKRAS